MLCRALSLVPHINPADQLGWGRIILVLIYRKKVLRNNQERKENVSRLKNNNNLKIKHMMNKIYKIIKNEERLFINARE